MNDIKSTINLGEYIGKLKGKGQFIIPKYQRGYIWGQYNRTLANNNMQDSVTYLVDSILQHYKNKAELFMQGITVSQVKDQDDYVIVDGQQRTTFFYLLLKFLGYSGYIKIHYDVRTASNDFLTSLNIDDCQDDPDEEYQDIYFFKKTLRVFHKKLRNDNIDINNLLYYILHGVKFLFIDIPSEKAKIVFTMMNGNKSVMRQEELIKSELLRCSTINGKTIGEAENTTIRSRYAREWDKWLYWWNDERVKSFYKTDLLLGWLLPITLDTTDVSFETYKNKCLHNGTIKEAKENFRTLRLLQQRMVDIYDDPITYNYVGAIMCIRDNKDRFSFLKWYLELTRNKGHEEAFKELRRYFDWAFIGVSHRDIVNNNTEKYREKREDFLVRLSDDQLYRVNYETGAKWLLRSNILEDCAQNLHKGRKFNFDIWNQRSLEHIYPKSKVGHIQNGSRCNWDDKPLPEGEIKGISLWRENIYYDDSVTGQHYTASEHSIGNLVLLYKSDNSEFSNASFEGKKNIYFKLSDDSGFQSRHLLHTVSVFANSKWDGAEIAKHKFDEISRFNNDYKEEYE